MFQETGHLRILHQFSQLLNRHDAARRGNILRAIHVFLVLVPLVGHSGGESVVVGLRTHVLHAFVLGHLVFFDLQI